MSLVEALGMHSDFLVLPGLLFTGCVKQAGISEPDSEGADRANNATESTFRSPNLVFHWQVISLG